MLRINIQEARTLPVSKSLVATLEVMYRKTFLKLIETYILEELETVNKKTAAFYSELLERLRSEFPELVSGEIPVDKNTLYYLIKNINAADRQERGIQITEIPIETVIDVLKKDKENPLKYFLKKEINAKVAEQRIREYFENLQVSSLGINIELQKTGEKKSKGEETYAGSYLADIAVITIAFEAAFFTGSIITKRDGNRVRISPRLDITSGKKSETIINYIKDELRDLPVSIRHELQHFYQSLFSKIFGKTDFTVGLPPQQVLRRAGKYVDKASPHYMLPYEMQTDIQDEIDKFRMDVEEFKNNNKVLLKKQPELAKEIMKIMIKIFSDSKLNDEENKLVSKYKIDFYVADASPLIRDIKTKDKSGELYKYALRTLFSSAMDLLKENIIMDKIKVILSETKLLSEELSKEEIRKLVRDELEKLLRDKETKKEMADIAKKMLKKLYRELSIDSTYIIDRIDI